MGITSLQVCMDSSDWLQGTIHEECAAGVGGMDSSSSPSGGDHINNLMTCSRPIIVDQRRLRPPHDHSIKCPRCDSTHTKFCYYNNYSLTQPRYFCKTCRRYWTKGGTLRNIPVGGGCRKNKKVSSKKSSNNNTNEPLPTPNNNSIPEMPFPLHNHHHFMSGTNFGHHGNFILENQAPVIDFMESKYEALVGSTSNTHSRNQDLFLGNGDNNIGMMMISGGGSSTTTGFGHGDNNIVVAPNYPFGMTSMDNGNNFGMLLPYENINHHHEEVQNINNNALDVKPNPKILSLEWHDNDQLGVNKESSSFGYYSGSGGLGSWTGLMNGTNCYGSSATNPLV